MRVRLQRLLLALLVLTGLYLVGVNLFLNSPLGPRAFNRWPARFQISWSSAWTVWPGLVRVRGLRLRGHVHDVTWFVDAGRASGWIDLPGLLRRTLRVRDLHLDEVRSRVLRGPEQETPADRKEDAEPEAPADPSYHPWTLAFTGIRLAHIREFAFNVPPLFQAAALTVDAQTPETRLSRLFATARDLKDPRKPAVTLPLTSDVRASGVRIEVPASRATLRATLDRAAGRIDLATHRTRGSVLLTSDDARVRFQSLELSGRLALNAPLVSPDLAGRRFDLAATRLALDGVSYRNVEGKDEAETPGWWARAELSGGSVVWGAPLSLRGEGTIDMESSGPLLALFAERSRFLRWFNDALTVEDIAALGVVRLGGGTVEVESLQATGGPLEVRSRMIFAKIQRKGDLYLRYGRLAAGIELRDGRRTFKLRQPLKWYESRPQP